MASPANKTNATSLTSNEQDIALIERRRALQHGAFVRYSNADILEKLRAASPTPSVGLSHSSPSSRRSRRDAPLSKSFNGGLLMPGNLYNPSEAESSPKLALHTAHSLRTASPESTVLLRSTLNGIGHAAILNDNFQLPMSSLSSPAATPETAEKLPLIASSSKIIPVIDTGREEEKGSHKSAMTMRKTHKESLQDQGLSVLLQSSHWQRNQRASKLIPLATNPYDSAIPLSGQAILPESASEAIALVTQEALEAQRYKVQQIKLQKEREAVEVLLKQPGSQKSSFLFDEDSLNLWQGKRLTGAESKVEQRLHVLRNNPVANKDLKEKVLGYIDEKHQEHQERQALAEFAAERRELKTIKFLSRSYKSSAKNQADPGSPPPISTDLFNSAYDPATGLPRREMVPLPNISMPFWVGMTRLSEKMEKLRELILWRHETKRRCRFKVSASLIIQKYWRGFKARQAISHLRSDVEKLRREEEKKLKMLAEGDAAQKVLAFLQHLAICRQGGNVEIQAEVSGRLSRSARSMSTKKTTQDILRRIRLDIMISQWNQVEQKVIEVAKKRIRTSAALGVESSTAPNQNDTQTKGHGNIADDLSDGPMLSGYSLTGMDDHVSRVVAAAVASIGVMDRIVMGDFTPVPKPVKITVIHSLMRERKSAYASLIGSYWRKKAKYRKVAREREAMMTLRSIVRRRLTEDGGDPPQSLPETINEDPSAGEGVAPEDQAEVKESGMRSSASSLKAVSTDPARPSSSQSSPSSPTKATRKPSPNKRTSTGLNTIEEDRPSKGTGPSNPGSLPRFRYLMTLPEIKAVMQLGVAETPSYKGFLLAAGNAGGNIQDMISKELLLMQRSESSAVPDEEMSFTLALLLHRWDAECTPKLSACMSRRFELSKTDSATAFAEGQWLPPADMAAKLMELRNG